MIKYFTKKNFLSEEEANKILKFSIQNLILHPAKVRDAKIDISSRKSSIGWINYDNIFPFLKRKLLEEISEKIKLKGYQINFDNSTFQFTEYKEGEYYNWHTDSSPDFNTERYCSVVIQLNDEYIGGGLELIIPDSKPVEIFQFENGVGNLFVFLSSIQHRVMPVESGVRYSLVNWFKLKPTDDYKKTII